MNPSKHKMRKIILTVLAATSVLTIVFIIAILSISGPAGIRSFYDGLRGKPTGDLDHIITNRDIVSAQLGMGTPVPEYRYERSTEYSQDYYQPTRLARAGATAIYYYALPQSVVTQASAEKLRQDGWDVFEGNLKDDEKSLSGTKGCLQLSLREPKLNKYSSSDEKAAIAQYGSSSTLTVMSLQAYKDCSK